MSASLLNTHDRLAARLPFQIDDTASAGNAFCRWVGAGKPKDVPIPAGMTLKGVVDLWTYCFVQRYFAFKFTRDAADRDALVGRAYHKIERGRASVRQPDQYPHWVSVVCQNTFYNHLRRSTPQQLSLSNEATRRRLHTERDAPAPFGSPADPDLKLAHKVVSDAIQQLPSYLRDVARLHLLEGCSYQEIRQQTQTPVPTARSYVSRARQRLCKMPAVRALEEDLR